jgi:hypothetical protein
MRIQKLRRGPLSDPILTRRVARKNGWRITAYCDRCRVNKELHVEALFRRFPDRDLGEALVRAKITCQKCDRSCSSLDVSRMQVGRIISVMKLAPGLTVVRHEADD